jgi:hypothetical protein
VSCNEQRKRGLLAAGFFSSLPSLQMSALLTSIGEWLRLRVWGMWKNVLRLLTGKTEIERIATQPTPSSTDGELQRQLDLLASLRRSSRLYFTLAPIFGSDAMPRAKEPKVLIKTLQSEEQVKQEAARVLDGIQRVKLLSKSSPALPHLRRAVVSAVAVNHLLYQLQAAAAPYDETNPKHEKLLQQVSRNSYTHHAQ